jgi:excisionase family DNA binding protein
MSDEKLAYRFSEAATLLGVSHDTLRRYVSRGELRAFKLARTTCIEAGELRRFVARLAEEHPVLTPQ